LAEVRKNELQPWKVKSWVIPPKKDGDFAANMENALDVNKRPYNEANPVVCMDESPKQLIKETRVRIPMKPGNLAKFDYE
jgi:hypothetical protein